MYVSCMDCGKIIWATKICRKGHQREEHRGRLGDDNAHLRSCDLQQGRGQGLSEINHKKAEPPGPTRGHAGHRGK